MIFNEDSEGNNNIAPTVMLKCNMLSKPYYTTAFNFYNSETDCSYNHRFYSVQILPFQNTICFKSFF